MSDDNSSSPTMTNVTATASGGSHSYALSNLSSSPVIRESTLRASGPSDSRALANGGGVVQIDNSRLIAPPTGQTLSNGSSGTVRIGASLLDGGAVNVLSGTVRCAGVYDESYAFFASTCP